MGIPLAGKSTARGGSQCRVRWWFLTGDTRRLDSLAATATIGFAMLLAHGLTVEPATVKLTGATPITAVIRELDPPCTCEPLMVSRPNGDDPALEEGKRYGTDPA
jgi:hypothetical protein